MLSVPIMFTSYDPPFSTAEVISLGEVGTGSPSLLYSCLIPAIRLLLLSSSFVQELIRCGRVSSSASHKRQMGDGLVYSVLHRLDRIPSYEHPSSDCSSFCLVVISFAGQP